MERLLRPIAFSVITLFGGLPAAQLACQWACGTPVVAESASHHGNHHQSDAPESDPIPAGAGLTAASLPCAHVGSPLTAVSSLQPKVVPPGAVQNRIDAIASAEPRTGILVIQATYSPPGIRLAAPPLRI